MYKHVIPVNVQDNGNFGNGFLKKRNTIEAAIIIVTVFFFFKYVLIAVPFLIKTILFVSFGLLPSIIALIGIGDESLSEALTTMISYKRVPQTLDYSLAALGAEEERKEKKKEKLKGKEKRAQKNAEKKARKEEKTQKKPKENISEEKPLSKREEKKLIKLQEKERKLEEKREKKRRKKYEI